MKKVKFLLLLIAISLSIANYAQKGLNFKIILQPGLSMGGKYQVTENYYSSRWVSLNKAPTFGINTGVVVGYTLNESMGLSSGLLFSHQGQNYKKYKSNGADIIRTLSLNYFKIPILFDFVSNSKQDVSFVFSAGFYLGFLLNYKDKIIITDGSETVTQTATGDVLTLTDNSGSSSYTESAAFLSKPYKSSDFGSILGLGFQFKLSDKICLPLMLVNQIGFRDVKNKSSLVTQGNSSNAELFWQNSNNNSPNAILSYHNVSIGLEIGLKMNIGSAKEKIQVNQ